MTPDDAWRELAEGSRTALDALGFEIGPKCLPGEPEACGGSFREHATAHLAGLQAVINHHWQHIGGRPDSASIFAVTYQSISEELRRSHREEPAP